MPPSEWQRKRSTFLAILFPSLLFAAAIVSVVAACGGLGIAALLTIGAVALLGIAHYLFWGRALNIEVAGEREEEEIRRDMASGNGGEARNGSGY